MQDFRELNFYLTISGESDNGLKQKIRCGNKQIF